jgi:signal transduction histidine kinase
VHRSQLERLPLIIERAVRDYETGVINDRLRYEVRQATDLMRESQRLVTVGRLAGSIAHEINNPLESVTNLLYLLSTDESLSDRARDYLKLAQRELDRVAQIAKQTLNFYRNSPHPIRIQPAELIEEVLVLYARRITEKRIIVVREFEAARTITASPGEMRQVFSNLITNAIEAIEPGGKLHLRVRDCRRWGSFPLRGLRISIADNGGGMSREIRRRLGEPFFTTKGQQGTGLGLWVTQSIVQRHGGTMQVSSSTDTVQHGTVFSIFLPVTHRPQSVVAINDPHAGSTHYFGHGGGGRPRGFGPNASSRREFLQMPDRSGNGTE